MGSFLDYYVSRRLEGDGVLSESFDPVAFVRKSRRGKGFKSLVRKLSERKPSAQHCDVEEAVRKSLKGLSGSSDERSAERKVLKKAESLLSEIMKGSKGSKKNLSCPKSVKGLSRTGGNLKDLLSRAGRILTGKEKRALELCSEGKSVREIGSLMKVSFATAWRVLNSALDKVRISHGMKSRNKDRR